MKTDKARATTLGAHIARDSAAASIAAVGTRAAPLASLVVIASAYGTSPSLDAFYLSLTIPMFAAGVLGMAISAHTLLAFAPRDDSECRLLSENYPGEVRFDIAALSEADPEQDGKDWGSYARGAAALLRDRLPQDARGIDACAFGRLLGGGLSSTAWVTLS